ncbi:MAG: type I restriction enzyme HsdR N-terminal domain-containing protein, partial [Paludibacteraceae bacterium]|nr:type I restriction enzyme HsdR N-terminal domain-containing protein [Paludibacteraceae bacterium]
TPLCIIEFKAESVPLTQRVFDQVAVYNRRLRVPLGIVSNGPRTIAYRITSAGYSFLPAIPSYPDLSSPSYPDLSSPSYPDLSPQPTRDAGDSPADSPVIRP